MRGLGAVLALMLWATPVWAAGWEDKLLDAERGPKLWLRVDGESIRVETVFRDGAILDKEILHGSLAGVRAVSLGEGPDGEQLLLLDGAGGTAEAFVAAAPEPLAAWAGFDPWADDHLAWRATVPSRPTTLSFRVAEAQAPGLADKLRKHLAALRGEKPAAAAQPAAKPKPLPAAPKPAPPPPAPALQPVDMVVDEMGGSLRDIEGRQQRLLEVRAADNAQHCLSPSPKSLYRGGHYEHQVWVTNRCAGPVLVLVCYQDGSECGLDTVPAGKLGKFPLSVEASQAGFDYKLAACMGNYLRGCDGA